MKSLIQIVLIALVVGGLSAGGSFYWKNQLSPPPIKAGEPKANETATNAEGQPEDAASQTDGPVAEATSLDSATASDTIPQSKHNSTEVTHATQASTNKKASGDSKTKTAADSAKESHATVSDKHSDKHVEADKRAESNNVAKAEPPYIPPVAARPPYVPEGDEAGRLISALRSRVHAVDAAERQIADREAAMKLIFDDLRSEQANATKFRQRVIEEAGEASRFVNESLEARKAEQESLAATRQEKEGLQIEVEKLRPLAEDHERVTKELEKLRPLTEEHDRLQKELEKLRSAANELDQLRKKSGADGSSGSAGGASEGSSESSGQAEPSPNLKKTAAIYDTMPPENTAKVVQQLVKNNRTQSAVALLNAMKERPTSKVLSNIAESDPVLAADLTERLKRFKKDTVPQPLSQ